MVTRKMTKSPARQAAPGRKNASPAKKASAPKAPASPHPPAKAGRKAEVKATPRREPARSPAASRGAVRAAPDKLQERVGMLQIEKADLEEIVRRLKAERDSSLAEAQRLGERVRDLETQISRRSAAEPQKAGPGAFDPSVDLDEERVAVEDELEEAAGFFDRMDEIRARRIELDRERNDRELEQSEQPFWLICPKCGELMEEQESENIKLERCENCGGLYLDRGEVDLLLSLTADRDGMRRLHNALKF